MTHSGWRTISTEAVYRDKWFNVDVDLVKLPNGRREKFTVVKADMPTGHCVGIVPFASVRDVLLVKQYRYRYQTLNWEIPTGIVNENETFRKAAARELREETGYCSRKLKPILTYHPNMSIIQTAHLFMAENLVKGKLNAQDEAEFILEVKRFSLPKALRMIEQGKIKDSLSIIGLILSYLYRAGRFPFKSTSIQDSLKP